MRGPYSRAAARRARRAVARRRRGAARCDRQPSAKRPAPAVPARPSGRSCSGRPAPGRCPGRGSGGRGPPAGTSRGRRHQCGNPAAGSGDEHQSTSTRPCSAGSISTCWGSTAPCTTPARWARPSATSSRRHIQAASRGSTPSGVRRAPRRGCAARRGVEHVAAWSGRCPCGGTRRRVGARRAGSAGRRARRSAAARCLARHQVVVGRVPDQLQLPVRHRVQVGEVTLVGEGRGGVDALGAADRAAAAPQIGEPGERRRSAGPAVSGWVRRASRRYVLAGSSPSNSSAPRVR